MNSFTRGDEFVYSRRRIRLLAEMNSVTRGDELVLLKEMNSFTRGDELIYSRRWRCFALYLVSDIYCMNVRTCTYMYSPYVLIWIECVIGMVSFSG